MVRIALIIAVGNILGVVGMCYSYFYVSILKEIESSYFSVPLIIFVQFCGNK